MKLRNQTKGATRLRGLLGSSLIVGAAMSALSGCGSGGSAPIAIPTPTPTPTATPNPTPTPSDAPAQLIGQWRLVATSGGITGGGYSFTPGSEFVTFNDDGVFFRTTGNNTSRGTYKVTVRKTPFSESSLPVVTYSAASQTEVVTQVSDTRLVLAEEAADGYSREYERVILTAN